MLEIVVVEYSGMNQNRDFCRVHVNADITITANSILSGKQNGEVVLTGRAIDLTGSGILVSLSEKPPAADQVSLEISLPTDPPEQIKIEAHPIRTIHTSDNQWKVAYRFDIISEEERDKIIGFCLVEQRRRLRLDHGIRGSKHL